MARFSDITTNFSGGLITDYVSGRTDLQAVKNSCRKFNNFLPILQGPARYRAGFMHLNTSESADVVASAEIILATNQSYLAVFTQNVLKIYSSTGTLLDTITTPYSANDIPELRFASETDVLYVCHGSYKPRKLTVGITIAKAELNTTESDGTNDALYTTEADTSNLQLRADTTVTLDTNWDFSVINFDVEPFLEPDVSKTGLSLTRNEHYVKLTSTTNTFADIVAAGDGNWENWYVEYSLDGEKLLGRVRDAAHDPLLADPTATVVYVQPVDSVVDIQDDDAKLFLLDAEETSDAEDLEKLKLDGVPNDKIHLRSDTLVFNKSLEDSWIRVGSDRRDNKVVVGEDRTTTRWVKIKDYRGTENHPTEFYRGTTAFDNANFNDGSIYKVYSNEHGNGSLETNNAVDYFFSLTTDTSSGHFDVIQNIVKFYSTLGNDSRVFTFRGLLATAKQNTVDPDSGELITGTADSVVGNLSTVKEQAVVECYSVADGTPKVESGTNLVVASDVDLVVDEIKNTLNVFATAPLFDPISDRERFVLLEYPSGYVTIKLSNQSSDITSTTAVADVKSAIPFKKGTKNIENDGQALGFQLGAWFVDNYPRTVAKYERRVVYGGTYYHPNYLFISRVDNEFDFSPAQEDKIVLDTDGITYPLSATNASVRFLVPGKDLAIGTTGGIFRMVPNQFEFGISPKTVRIELSDEEGVDKQGIVVNNSLFFPNQSGSQLLEYKYEQQVQQSTSNDITKFIYPTFNEDPIVQIVHQRTPQPRVWVRTQNKNLYCLSHHRQEDYYAWSKHGMDNTDVLDIAVLHEAGVNDLDGIFIQTKRDTGGTPKYAIEKLTDENTAEEIHLDGFVKFLDLDVQGNQVSTKITLGSSAVVPTTGLRAYIIDKATNLPIKLSADPYMESGSTNVYLDTTALPTDYTIDANTRWDVYVGQHYTGELQMMYPTWDGGTQPAYGADETRVVSIKPYFIDSHSYQAGIKGQFKTTNFSSTPFTGFDKDRPVANSKFGAENVPEFKHDQPYDLTIAAVVVRTDIGNK